MTNRETVTEMLIIAGTENASKSVKGISTTPTILLIRYTAKM